MGGACALLFALFHRHSYSGCKPAIGDVDHPGSGAALAAEVNIFIRSLMSGKNWRK